MSDKSFVTLEQHACVVCGSPYDTGALLMDTRLTYDPRSGTNKLRETFHHKTVTGWGFCPEHQKMKDDGYIALVACDEKRSELRYPDNEARVDPAGAYRTGRIAHVKRDAWSKLFNFAAPEGGVVFIDDAGMDKLERLAPKEDPQEGS